MTLGDKELKELHDWNTKLANILNFKKVDK